MQADLWLRTAGYLTWLVSGIPGLINVFNGEATGGRAAGFLIAFALFGLGFSGCMRASDGGYRRSLRIALLAVQTGAGLVMVATSGDGLPAATLVVVAGQLIGAFDTRASLLWIAGQSLCITAIFWTMGSIVMAIAVGGAFTGFQLFAIATSWLAHSESVARQDLARANAELTATRELLAENSRVDERLRISRDLHDTLGHHLTALSIQLEVASRLTDGAAATHIREAHALAKLLLSDVRDVVGKLRDSRRLDLSQALRALAIAPGPPQIHFEMPERLDVEDSAQAHALLRCVQEIITNTARHASAKNLWITIAQNADGIDLRARDDGRGASALEWGNGLRGMRERFEEYAGRVEVQSATGQGFEVRAFMPRSFDFAHGGPEAA